MNIFEASSWNDRLTRREFIWKTAAGGALLIGGGTLLQHAMHRQRAATFISRISRYEADITTAIRTGLRELGITPQEINGKRILLKPNLVEPYAGISHICTHPLVVRGAIEAFLSLGAARVTVADGPGHCRDSFLVLEESGLRDVLREDRIPFVDLNYDAWYTVRNAGRHTNLTSLTFPAACRQADWIVSMPKLKTHHWAGVTLSMKNMFGVMPGIVYGWPKNIFHFAGIEKSIHDINATLRPHFAIVDGIVGMEGDGPIMGTPRHAGVLVMGRNLPAVDATCSRIMGVDPHRITYLAASENLGSIAESAIEQRGEGLTSVRTNFALLDHIHAHRGIRLG